MQGAHLPGGIHPGDVDELPVVVCTEIKDNEGMSITNAVEQIANKVLASHPDMFSTIALVTFPGYEVEDLGAYMGEERKRIGEPSWSALDRATVVALVGEALD